MHTKNEWVIQPNGTFKKIKQKTIKKNRGKWTQTENGSFKKKHQTQYGSILFNHSEQKKQYKGEKYIILAECVLLKINRRGKKETRIPNLVLKIIENDY